MAAAKAKPNGAMTIPPINIQRVLLHVVGDSALITHAWSEKAKATMRDKQQGKAKNKKEPKDPEAEYQAAFYRLPGGEPAVPAVAFKASAVGAARFVDGLPMTILRGALHVDGELIEIDGEPYMREDMVRIGMGTADLRYRPCFPEWSAVVPVSYNADVLTEEQVVHLFNAAGFGQGICEWRPSSKAGGPHGRFHVESIDSLG